MPQLHPHRCTVPVEDCNPNFAQRTLLGNAWYRVVLYEHGICRAHRMPPNGMEFSKIVNISLQYREQKRSLLMAHAGSSHTYPDSTRMHAQLNTLSVHGYRQRALRVRRPMQLVAVDKVCEAIASAVLRGTQTRAPFGEINWRGLQIRQIRTLRMLSKLSFCTACVQHCESAS